MVMGTVKWFDSEKSEFAIIEQSSDNKIIILDTKSIDIPDNYIAPGDKIEFEAQLSPFGLIAKEFTKV